MDKSCSISGLRGLVFKVKVGEGGGTDYSHFPISERVGRLLCGVGSCVELGKRADQEEEDGQRGW